jgi:hypothetical protein
MSDYNKSTNFTSKDTLPTGNAQKLVKGTELDIEFTAISSAVASKANSDSPAFTGVPTAATASVGTNTTQLATTAFVLANLGNVIPAGSVMLFYQSAAPTGWTQVTTLNDYDLRLVSGAGGTTGGTTAYSTVFANQTVSTTVSISGTTGATTLSTSQMPSHAHSTGLAFNGGSVAVSVVSDGSVSNNTFTTSTDSQGGNGSHTHSFSGSGSGTSSAVILNVRYANIIICSKN